MTTTYRITSKAGADHGTWSGETAAEALAALHRDAGYDVHAEGGSIVWPDDEARRICGDVDDWCIVEVVASTPDAAAAPESDERFWTDDRVGTDEVRAALPGWYGIVDEQAGGVVAFAQDEQTAMLIRDALRAKHGEN